MSINRVTISGNLTRDCELRLTQGGTQVLTFGVAVNDRRKNPKTGEWEDYPNFIDCTMFGTRAEKVSGYIGKGSKVCIDGKLRWSQWEKDGQKRSKVEVVVDNIEFMGQSKAKNGQSQQQANNYSNQQQNGAYSASQQPTSGLYDEDIPF